MVRVVIIEDGEAERALDLAEGLSLMEGIRSAGMPLLGECEGSLACSSCHVWMDEASFERLPPAGVAEEDLLDVTFNLTLTSRLACQIKLSPDLDGLRLRLPGAS